MGKADNLWLTVKLQSITIVEKVRCIECQEFFRDFDRQQLDP